MQALTYPTVEQDSHISFHSRTARFSFGLAPLTSSHTSRLPSPASNPSFPFATAPPGTKPLKGEIALEDVSTRGISCFRAEQPMTVPCLPPYRRGSFSSGGSSPRHPRRDLPIEDGTADKSRPSRSIPLRPLNTVLPRLNALVSIPHLLHTLLILHRHTGLTEPTPWRRWKR